MKRNGSLVLVSACALLSWCLGCGAPGVQRVPANTVRTCIQGKVWMENPIDSKQVPWGGVMVNAWRHGKELALAETRTDSDGTYCIEVPVEGGRVDLRVWGVERMEGNSYICQGSVQNIDPGKTPKKCGEDCFKTDIMTQCQERPGQRLGG